ncbi:MAG: DNA polymerase III subunit gamma/tau [Patescibacteria group bacterium]
MNWNQVYRPTQISDLHLKVVREYCQKLLTSDSFPQAFLFAGPKGTGKTSTARILGAVLNNPSNATSVQALLFDQKKPAQPLQEPDTSLPLTQAILQGQSYLVQEQDAASNRGIDDIRALKQSVYTPPASGLVSVYILDEVHMLTTEAFNALLKMLEEPPPHAVFVLATTELHKIPATVVSRCQVIHFYRASVAEISAALNAIIKKEKLSIDPEVVAYIAQQADGSFRDSIKLLQMVTAQGLTDISKIDAYLGTTNHEAVEALVATILQKDAAAVVAVFESLRQNSTNEVAFHKSVLEYLHGQLVQHYQAQAKSPQVPQAAAQYLLQHLSSAALTQASPIPFLRLEIAILELIQKAQQKPSHSSTSTNSAQAKNAQTSSTQTKKTATTSSTKKTKSTLTTANNIQADVPLDVAVTASSDISANASEVASVESTILDQHSGSSEKSKTLEMSPATMQTTPSLKKSAKTAILDPTKLCQDWSQFVHKIALNNFSLGTLLKSAQPQPGEEGELILEVYYSFHQEQLKQPKFQQLLNEHIMADYGGSLIIRCQIVKQPDTTELIEPVEPALEKLAVEALM